MTKNNNLSKSIAIWLLLGVFMILVQILLGGITRLSGSGLSITEWNITTKIFLPSGNGQWLTEFEKYRQTSQYRLINYNFTLENFKAIYFWEWLHRLWAKLMGLVFLIPFLFFLFRKRFDLKIFRLFFGLFLLGALLGTVGWIMVMSGLTGDAIYVQPVKLAIHFLLATILLCYTFWLALHLLITGEKIIFNPALRKINVTIILFLFVQLFFGALMAGYKAAVAAPTWPDINGAFFPPQIFDPNLPLFKNIIAIQFIHRMIAYSIFILFVIKFFYEYKLHYHRLSQSVKWLSYGLVILQICLGILTLLNSIHMNPATWGKFESLALAHQFTGILLVLTMILSTYLLRAKKIKP